MFRLVCPLLLVVGAIGFVACSTKSPNAFDSDREGGAADGGGQPANDRPGESGTFSGTGSTWEGGVSPGACVPSPENFEVPGNGCDDDGDGQVDVVDACDSAAGGTDANAFAMALGLCQTSTPTSKKWGVVSASFARGHDTTAPPNPAQHGILPKFGNVIRPREGAALGVLSTGFAREFDSASDVTADFKNGGERAMQSELGKLPPGFPKASQGCGFDIAFGVYDTIAVKLEVRVPTNAKAMSFDFNFWSGEWPEYVCSDYNDGFIAYLKSEAFNGGAADNISFDAQNNPVSVNNGFFDRCTPQTTTGCRGGVLPGTGHIGTAACPGGTSELAGTGFAGPEKVYCEKVSSAGGATGWLQSKAPVKPGEILTLEFILWDKGDSRLDSSVLLDNFRWEAAEVVGPATERPR